MEERKFIINKKEEFQSLYFDKIISLALDKCLRLHKEHKIALDDHEMGELVDLRNKHIEACLDKVFALHRVFDEEFFKNKI
jgi:hypothetical protein